MYRPGSGPRWPSARARRPGDGVTDPQWSGVDQHKGDAGAPVAAIGPGVVGAALDHDVARLHLHRRIVHVHLDLALEHDDVIDGLGAVHARLVARREINDGEPRPVRRRGGADDARAQILDLFPDRDVGRRAVGRPDQRRDGAGARILCIGGGALHEHLGDVIGVVAGHETANGRILFGHDCYPCLQRGFPNIQSSFAPTALISAPQCAKSSWMSLENCAGVRSTRSKLFTRKNSRDCGNSKTLATSAWIFATSSGAMFAGPNSTNQAVREKPGPPASAIVGKSGRSVARFSPAAARILTFPVFSCSSMLLRLSSSIATSPASSAVAAGAPAREGVCTRLGAGLFFKVFQRRLASVAML